MKRKLLIAPAVLLFLFGLGVLLYPTIRTAAFRQAERREIRCFQEYRAENRAKGGISPDTSSIDAPEDIFLTESSEQTEPAETERAFPELWEACAKYNAQLVENQRASLTASGMDSPALVLSDYGWEEDVFAALSIPSAGIETPLYLGASRSNLTKGGVILGQTSLPIGGESTHCVIGGHRTWNAILHPFISLEEVAVGDLVQITNPWESLNYRVISTQTIYPDDLEQVRIQPGRDLLSIFTCTYPNTRRVLVTCERICKEGD